MILAVGNDGQFARFCEVADHVANGRRIRASRPIRSVSRIVQNSSRLIEAVTVTRTTQDWIEALEQAGVPCGPINPVEQVFSDPAGDRARVAHRRAERVGRRDAGRCQPDPDVAHSRCLRRGPPLLGEHTSEILGDWLQQGAGVMRTTGFGRPCQPWRRR